MSSGSACPQGQTFDGMESWLPWLTEGEHVLFDLVGADALVLLRRAPPHARPGRRPAGRGGRPRRAPWPRPGAPRAATAATTTGSRACTCPSTGCSPTPTPRRGPSPPPRRGPTSPPSPRWAWPPRPATRSGSCASSPSWPADGYRIVVAADGEGSAARLARAAAQPRHRARRSRWPRSSGAASSRPSSWP